MRTKQVFTNKGNGVVYATLHIFQGMVHSRQYIDVLGNGKAKCNYSENDVFDERVGTKIAAMRAEKMAYKLAAQAIKKEMRALETESKEWLRKADKVEKDLNDYIDTLKQ